MFSSRTRHPFVGSVVILLLVLLAVHPVAAKSPGILLTVTEPTLGQWLFLSLYGNYPVSVAPGQPLDFNWSAQHEIEDGSAITGYRYGWDVVDFNDPDDAGWATPGWEHVLSAPTMSFMTGTHRFTVLVTDDIGRVTSGEIVISVDPALSTEPGSVGRVKGGWSE